MMYQILIDNHIVHNEYEKGLQIYAPKVQLQQNEIGSFTFTIYPTNPYYSQIVKMKSVVTVYQNTYLLFNGRVVETTQQTNNGLEVYCESDESYLLDTVQDPYDYTGSITGLLQQFITAHNWQVDASKQFTLGTVTVVDDNDVIVRSNTEYSSTWEAIKNKLFNSALGGYLVIRHENGTKYVDYLSDFTTMNAQHIVFGENMQSVTFNNDYSDFATVLIPLGAQDENGDRLTIVSVNGGVKYIEDAAKVATYGRIVKKNTWDDVTVASNLKTKGQAYLSKISSPNTSIEVSAVDLANLNQNITNFHMHSKIKITSAYHNVDEYFSPLKMTVDLFNQKNNKITLNGIRTSMTEDDRGISGIKETLETVAANANVNIPQRIATLRQELTSLIQQTSTSIKTEISQAYYAKDDNTDLIRLIGTQFEQSSQSFEMRFQSFQQDLEALVDGTNASFEDIRRYIRFIDGNIILGQIGNEFSLKITSTRISFYQGQNEIAYISNSKLYTTYVEVLQQLSVGNFGFIVRSSGNLSFKKVSG